ncbi:hypothetical protein C791_8516 [Amycolatopsis azurea DSM 43854]|uniref:Uncharacterized protein n=1 Tax=Amycolatopsis azurea DSM 43854 TaxID=1238180 RepID=M2Q6G5_9PSEU|nr:hypothetical protein C791_8516 [Amycolatopsis azurea DSM 43854]
MACRADFHVDQPRVKHARRGLRWVLPTVRPPERRVRRVSSLASRRRGGGRA